MTNHLPAKAPTIDRISCTRRPSQTPVGYQSWQSLLFMHWPVPVELLRPLVPASLKIDQFDGTAYVGLVPFAMREVRPRWAPRSLGFHFLETNVRTYVTHGNEPGVYFFSLDAASRIGVWTARWLWGLPYFYASMSMEQQADLIHYRSTRSSSGDQLEVRCRLGPALPVSQPDSIEFFFLERYLLFLEQHDRLYRGQVHHRPYPVHQAEVLELHDELLPAAGVALSATGTAPAVAGTNLAADRHARPPHFPDFTHFSPGVEVEIFALQPVDNLS